MATLYRPVTDGVGVTSDWTASSGADFFDLIDESSADDDTTYITRDANTAHIATPSFQIAPFTDPGTSSGWTVTVRGRMVTGLTTGTCQVRICNGDPNDGGAVIESIATQNFSTTTYVTKTFTIASATMDTMRPLPSDLWVAIEVTGSGGSRFVRVTQMYLSAPDPVATGGDNLSMCMAQ